jgi:2-keto-4-pentenoate hydratase/2-oxohepta-3-ene-1,7-dioic acid hydratase in catechol pathway
VGGGCGLEAGRLLESGDLVELTIAGIGTLRSRIFASQ